MHKSNSIFEAANSVLLGEAAPKFELTPKIKTILNDLSVVVTERIEIERQIKILDKELDKNSKKHHSVEEKYWKEVDRMGISGAVSTAANAALWKVANSKT